jgi:hypothetical protein
MQAGSTRWVRKDPHSCRTTREPRQTLSFSGYHDRPFPELKAGCFQCGSPPIGLRRFRHYKGVARTINRHQTRRLVSDGCQSGRLGTPGKRVYRKVPRVRIPPHPPIDSSSNSSSSSSSNGNSRIKPPARSSQRGALYPAQNRSPQNQRGGGR